MLTFIKNWFASKEDLIAALLDFCLGLSILTIGILLYNEAFEILGRTDKMLAAAFHTSCVAGVAWYLAKKYYGKVFNIPRKIFIVIQEEQEKQDEKLEDAAEKGVDESEGESEEDDILKPY